MEEHIEVEGNVSVVLPGTMFRVKLDNQHEVLAHISGKMRKRFIRLRVGEIIFHEGDPGDGLYIVNEGLVQICVVVGENQRRVLSRIGPGDFFGEMSVLEARPRSASAIAEQDSTVSVIRSEELMKVLE